MQVFFSDVMLIRRNEVGGKNDIRLDVRKTLIWATIIDVLLMSRRKGARYGRNLPSEYSREHYHTNPPMMTHNT